GYDPETRRVFVVNGGATGDISVISPEAGAIVGTISLAGKKLEELQLDNHGHGYVNDEGQSAVHVFDTHNLKRLTSWSTAPGEEPTGLAFDRGTRRLFAACGNNKLVTLDMETGKVIGVATIGKDPDGAVFDPKTHRVFVSNRDGTLSIVDAS